jgi:hypothetical protein
MNSRRRGTLFFLFCFLSFAASAQEGSPTNRVPNAPTMPHGTRQQENAVATLFNTIRADAKLHRLGRIKDREELQQLVCTVTVSDGVPPYSTGHPALGSSPKFTNTDSALYRTAHPQEVTAELERVALFVRPGHSRGYARYAVAVWPVNQGTADKIEYWVGVKLYMGETFEFFDNNFTDEMFYKNSWKKIVAPECKNVK